MSTINRRYDIDWIRVIAIGLLLIYHVAIGFQSWGIMIGFMTSSKTWETLWIPMSMLNVWRIPLLFFVSGMGVYFAIQNRNWKQLLRERAARILLPFLVGIFLIVPIHTYLWQAYYHMDLTYAPNPGHLWFLGNLFVYVVVLSPLLFYLKRKENEQAAIRIKSLLSNPLALLPIIAAFVAEALLVNPNPYTLYAMTWHGFFLGLLAFLVGFCLVWAGPTFWQMLLKWRWFFLSAASVLFAVRLVQFQLNAPNYLLAIESNGWIFSVFGFGYRYLNHPSKTLRYLSEAAYPVYILHMLFLYLASWLIFPLKLEAPMQFLLVLGLTTIGCFGVYEGIIRRINFIRPLFGLKKKSVPTGKYVVSGS